MNARESSFGGLRGLVEADIKMATSGLNLMMLEDALEFDRIKYGLATRSSDGQGGFSPSNCLPIRAKKKVSWNFPVNVCSRSETAEVEAHQPCTANVSRTVFVGNLDFKANPASIRIFFKKFGGVKDVFLIRKHGNRTYKRIAFVKFAKMESAKRAIEATEEEATMDNRPLRIFPATDRKRGKVSHDESRCNADANVESVQKTSVELYDDAMLLIFKYLNAEDLLKVEKVNKRWRNLAMTAWACKQQLSFNNCFSPFMGKIMTNGLFKGILSRCGSNLKLLDISTVSRLLDPSAVNIIGKYCQNLEVLDISGLHSTNEYMVLFAKSCVKLKKITLGVNGTTSEKGIWSLLNNCQNLEYVDISYNNRATGKCFHKCGPKVRVLKLSYCIKIGPTGFEKIAQRCSEIVELHMNSCVLLTNKSLEMICASCTKISILNLGGRFVDLTAEGLSHIKHLRNLEELYLEQNKAVDDDLLIKIGRSCRQLTVLDVSACSNEISDVGVMALSNCSKLSILNVSYLQNWTDDSLVSLSGSCPLTELKAKACIAVTDVGCQAVLNICPHLQLLDVSGCALVTNATVLTAFEAVKNRDNGLKLWITVGRTGIKMEVLQFAVTQNPLVDVNFEDTCVKRLIPSDSDSYWDSSDEDEDYYDNGEEDWMGYSDHDNGDWDDDSLYYNIGQD